MWRPGRGFKTKSRVRAQVSRMMLKQITVCDGNCRLELQPVAVIFDDRELERLLKHFHLHTEFPKFRPAPQQGLFAVGNIGDADY